MELSHDMMAAYAAGIFDAEGSISITCQTHNRRIYHRLIISLSNCDKGITDWLHRSFGGNISESTPVNKKWRTAYQWQLNGKATRPFLKAVQPYSLIMGKKIEIALDFIGTLKPNGRISQKDFEYRASLRDLLEPKKSHRHYNHLGRII